MIFVGDIAIPSADIFEERSIEKIEELFSGKTVIGNLEGSVCRHCDNYLEKRIVFNAQSALSILKRWNIDAVNLANNHIFDIPNSLASTKKALTNNGIDYFGAGKNVIEAGRPSVVNSKQERNTLMGLSWEAVRCETAAGSEECVSALQYGYVHS
jgi:poly-gamma-glutamate capsule biosynthesis protein CapA/YwtB (metallophosphatase superfamily)